MPSQSEKQPCLDFKVCEDEAANCASVNEGEAESLIDYSFVTRRNKKETENESKIYEGILSLIKHRYP